MTDRAAVAASPAATPLVTVVIPAFNARETIGATLASLGGQGFRDFEALVVDDGSTDGTADVAARFAATDGRFRVIRQLNAGQASARNRGLRDARGPFLANLDADDLWRRDMLARLLDALRDRPEIVLAYSWFAHIDARDRVLALAEPTDEGDVIARMCRGNLLGTGSSALMRTDAVRAVGGWDAAIPRGGNEDYDLFFKLAERGEFAVVRDYLLGYRRSRGNTSAQAARMLASYDVVAARFRARHPAHAPLFNQGRLDLIAYLFDKAIAHRRPRVAATLLREAAAADRRAALLMLRSVPRAAVATALPLPLVARLNPFGAGTLRKGLRFPTGS